MPKWGSNSITSLPPPPAWFCHHIVYTYIKKMCPIIIYIYMIFSGNFKGIYFLIFLASAFHSTWSQATYKGDSRDLGDLLPAIQLEVRPGLKAISSILDHVVSFQMTQKSGSNDEGLSSVTATWVTGSTKGSWEEVRMILGLEQVYWLEAKSSV